MYLILMVYFLIQKNKKHGYGIYYFESGDVYEGSWLHDAQSGFGKYMYKNGDFYEGKLFYEYFFFSLINLFK